MTKICRSCKTGTMIQVESSQELSVKGVELCVDGLRHLECQNCHAQVETPDQMDFNAERIRVALKQRRISEKEDRGLLVGTEIRKLREYWGITQAQAASIFGGGPTAFAKYEAEDVSQSAAMDKLLRVARAIPMAFIWLADHAKERSVAIAEMNRFVATIEKMLGQQRKTLSTAGLQARHSAPVESSTLVIGQVCANDHTFSTREYA